MDLANTFAIYVAGTSDIVYTHSGYSWLRNGRGKFKSFSFSHWCLGNSWTSS